MTTTAFLVRHGAHDRLNSVLCGRMGGVSLSEQGRREAARVAASLALRRLTAVISSPMERARETARPIAVAAGLDVIVDEDLNEIDFGAWTGVAFDDLHGDPGWKRWNELRLHHRPPGGESMLEIQARAARVLTGLTTTYPHGAVALVSHGDIIKSALCWVLGLPLEFHSRLDISPASVSRIMIGDWGAKIGSINEDLTVATQS